MTDKKKHPAKFSKPVLPILAHYLERVEGQIIDPMAGVGTLAWQLNGQTILPIISNELELEWATQCPGPVTIADACRLPYRSNSIAAFCTSPTFANRMADHHNPKDGSVRHSYKFYLDRDLHPANTGQMQWGPDYRKMNKLIWKECYRALEPGGRLVFDVSDHQRNWKIVRVSDWHRQVAQRIGFQLVDFEIIKVKRLRHGANHRARSAYEVVYYFEKPLDV